VTVTHGRPGTACATKHRCTGTSGDDIEPFWAVTRHADVLTVSDHPEVFINGGPRLRLVPQGHEAGTDARRGLDSFGAERGWDPDEPPDHRVHGQPAPSRGAGALSSWAYTQGAMRAMGPHFRALAEDFTAEFMAALAGRQRGRRDGRFRAWPGRQAAARGGRRDHGPRAGRLETDPGVVAKRWSARWTTPNRLPGESRGRAAYRYMHELRGYIEDLIEDSRQTVGATRGGLIDRMVHTPVDGKLLTNQQLNGYILLLIGAGNDTTRNALLGRRRSLAPASRGMRGCAPIPACCRSRSRRSCAGPRRSASFLRTAVRGLRSGRHARIRRRRHGGAVLPLGEPRRTRCSATPTASTSARSQQSLT
jgi:hypothetical protein